MRIMVAYLTMPKIPNSLKYHGDPRTYDIAYRSDYCGSDYKSLGTVTSNEDINKPTVKYAQNDIKNSDCRTRYEISGIY